MSKSEKNKPKADGRIQVSIYVDPDVLAEIDQEAKEEGRSRTAQIEHYIRTARGRKKAA